MFIIVTDREKPVLIITFDGVLYDYDKYGWMGIDSLKGQPLDGSKESIEEFRKAYEVYVYSDRFTQPRGIKAVNEWLEKHQIEVDGVLLHIIPHYIFIGVKNKEFPRRWKDDFVEEIKSLAPREG